MLIEPFEACLPVIRIFSEAGIDSFIGGSFATSYHGTPRSTNDVDLIADLRLAHVPLLVAGLKDRYYIDPEQVLQAIRRRGSFNILYLRTMFKIDIFVSGDDPFSRSAMRRRQRISLGEPPELVDIASAEDSILRKLAWYRLGNEVSERQWNDVLSVVKIQAPHLDLEYMSAMARQLEIEDLWDRLKTASALRLA